MRILTASATATTAHASQGNGTLCGTHAPHAADSTSGLTLCKRCVRIVEKDYEPIPRGEIGWTAIEGVAQLLNINWGSMANEVLMTPAERAEVIEMLMSDKDPADTVTRRWFNQLSDAHLLAHLDEATATA